MKILPTIKWLIRSWPILFPVILIGIHYYIVTQLNIDLKNINKLISLCLQIFGGILVLYSIDSNLGVVSKNSISALIRDWFKACPLFVKSITIHVHPASTKETTFPVSVRIGGSGNTTEEHLAYLQEQINWLKEDQKEHLKFFKQRLAKAENKSATDASDLRSSLNSMSNKLAEISIGGIKLQIFGVILMVYGSVVSYFT